MKKCEPLIGPELNTKQEVICFMISLKQIFPMHHFSLTLFEPQDTEDKSAAIHVCDGS